MISVPVWYPSGKCKDKLDENYSGRYYLFLLYYFIFTFLIKKLDFKTPGREDDDAETKLYTKADVNAEKKQEIQKQVTAGTSEDPVSAAITEVLAERKISVM